MTLTYLIFVLLINSIFCQAYYKKQTIKNDPNAKCLDGSTPIVYVDPGIKTRILFFLEGDGVCIHKTLETSLDVCVNRSLGIWGSSTKWPAFYDFHDYGMLDYNVTTNKFREWTTVVIM